MDTAIKGFQSDNGLKIDGRLKPGGETEAAMVESFFARPAIPQSRLLEKSGDGEGGKATAIQSSRVG
jgi:peptidoglycan hydrolase-like protein with peptidoglycan-binding domain